MAGSIEKRGKDSYRLIVCHGFNLEGKPIRHTKTVHGTKAQAKVELAKFVAEVEQGTVIEGKSITFKEFTDDVIALGTALTQSQGWLLRRSSEQVILGFDSDGAGQNAILRSIEILQNMGCDMRILQMEGAKDPDEYIIKFEFSKSNPKSI